MTRVTMKISSGSGLSVELRPTVFHFLWATIAAFPLFIFLMIASFYVSPPVGFVALALCVPLLILQWREFRFLRSGGDLLELSAEQFRVHRIEPSRNILRFWRSLNEESQSIELDQIRVLEFGTTERGETNALFAVTASNSKILVSRMTRALKPADRNHLLEILLDFLDSRNLK